MKLLKSLSVLPRYAASARRRYTTYSQLPEEHRMLYEMCRKFADEVLAPNAGKWDKTHSFPKEAIEQLVCFLDFVSFHHFDNYICLTCM